MNFNLARVRLPAGNPIGIVQGRPVYSILGAEDAPDPQSGDDGPDPTGQSDGDEDEPKKSDGQSAKTDETVSRSEYDKLKERLSAADRRANEAEKERKKLEQKDLGELEKAKVQVEELEQSVQSLAKEVSALRLQNAFLTNTSFTWHDPSDVLKLLKGDDSVSIDDNGNVVGMDEAIKELAKKKPYLVKSDKADPKGSTGDPSNGGKPKENKQLKEAELRKKYKIGRF